MRAAPPVQIHVPRRGAWLCFVTLLAGAAAAVACAWLAQRAGLDAPWLPAGLAFVVVAPVVQRLAPVDDGLLAWDGRRWQWRGQDGALRVAMDLGPVLLLRFEPSGGGRRAWFSVSAAASGALWHGLRAAVYFRGSDAKALTTNDTAPRT